MNLRRLNQWRTLANQGLTYLIALALGFNLVACGSSDLSEAIPPQPTTSEPKQSITEVSPPVAIQKLHQVLDQYQPQVTIISPKPDELLQDNTVNVQLNVQNFPVFQEETLGLSPHLQVILDNQPTQAIYDLSQPLTFEDLDPGTHTLRIFAAYPWDESYKNPEAYDQTVFHLFTRTPRNNPDLSQPLLTLNQPTGTYGAEPILLDFYLANPPVQPIDSEEVVEDTVDWKIQMTLNGESFLIDQWQPIYIKGVKSGKNWIQLQYLNQQGQPVNNVYNNTAKAFTYNPEVSNSLSQLFKGEFSEAQLQAIVDPDYVSEMANPVPEAPEPEELIEPAVLEENPLEESEPSSEETILSPVEGVLDDTEEQTATETPEIEADNLETAETVTDELVEEAIEQPETVEEPTAILEPVVEVEELPEVTETETDNLETVEEAVKEPETVEEPTAILEPVVEAEELPEVTETETDNLETVETVTDEPVEEAIEQPETVEEPAAIAEPVIEEEPSEITEIEDENLETVEAVTEEPTDETVIQIDETAETPIVVEEPMLEDTTIDEEITEIPEEIVEIDETPDVVGEESTEASQLEQPESEGWLNSIRKRIQLPFFQQKSVEMAEPQPVESVTIPEDTSSSEPISTKLSELREWFNSILNKIQLPFLK
jgi:hypothetical protein